MMQEMTREKFYDFAAAEIKNYIPGTFDKIEVIDVNSSRGEYKGLTAKKFDSNGAAVSPVVNLDKFYDEYQDETSLEAMFERMASIITMPPPMHTQDVRSFILDWDKVKDKLFVTLTNTKKVNTTVYNKVAGDVVMTARVLVDCDDHGVASAVVTEDLLKRWQQDKEAVIAYALENTRELMGLNIMNMGDMFNVSEGPKVKIVTNKTGNFGAAALFYPGVMEDIAEELHGSYYVLPSSVHEFLCMPKFGPTADELKELVSGINGSVVEDCDVLSNCVFYYDSETKKFMEV